MAHNIDYKIEGFCKSLMQEAKEYMEAVDVKIAMDMGKIVNGINESKLLEKYINELKELMLQFKHMQSMGMTKI